MNARRTLRPLLVSALLPFLAAGAVRATVPPERLLAREAFAERGFGIFVHWGVYAVWGKGEWYLSKSHMPLADYEAKAAEFNPTNFDARAWARAFKGAGARYVTITSRHHDGFSMFDTAQTDYDVVDATPFRRDPLKELAADYLEAFNDQYKVIEGNIEIIVEEVETPKTELPVEIQDNLVCAIYGCHNGVLRMIPSYPDVVETSSNLAIIEIGGGKASLKVLARSAREDMKEYIV